MFTSLMIPGASEEQMRWLDELQRVSVSAKTAYTARRQRSLDNVTELLPQLDIPTLVLHSRRDRMNDFEEGRYLASTIAGARLVVLESSNHILLGDEPAWQVFVDEVAAFMAPDRRPAHGQSVPMRHRCCRRESSTYSGSPRKGRTTRPSPGPSP